MANDTDSLEITLRKKINALYEVAAYRPQFATGIVILSMIAAMLEGIGISFLIPVINIAEGQTDPGEVSGIERFFVSTFEFLGVPFTLETVIFGIALVMVARYTASFLVAWLRAALQTHYIRHLQTKGFKNALNARIPYYDKHGSDEILNAIVTQSEYASQTIQQGVRLVEQGFLSMMYLAVALYIAPWLTILSGVILGGILYGFRRLIESGYTVGDRVAEANERIQEAVQAGTQGIREVKLYGLAEELFDDFRQAVNRFSKSQIKLRRNQAILNNFYQLVTALTVFILIYFAISISSLSLSSLGVFLFAMYRLAPRVSNLSDLAYNLEGNLPHMVRTQQFVSDILAENEKDCGEKSPPDTVDEITFKNVKFSYNKEQVLDGISFEIERGDFVAFVGPSGVGKSTIVALLARMYEPDSGQILATKINIKEFVIKEWREKLSVVRQDPFIFNKSLKYNITIGNRDASEEEIIKACKIAQVTEFLDDLPEGLDTIVGDEGVRLSGGQRQRVALARAILKDADLLILDEATSDLDSNIEEKVHYAIENMDRDYAIIVIAHRLSSVVNANCIYTLTDGEIKERGTHEELIDQDGIYADLYETQTQNR